METPQLTVLIPFYNEVESLAGTVDAVRSAVDSLGIPWELLLVDDGSTDGSAESLRAGDRRCVLSFDRNRGYGAALKRGLESARGAWVCILDADGSYPPEAIPGLWAAADGADMAIGRRDPGGVPLVRRPAKWVLRRLAAILSGESIPDLNSGLRIFRRSLAERYRGLYPNGFSFTTTITLAFLSSGRTIRYVPIAYNKRAGTSKIRPFRDTWRFLKLIFQLILVFNPMKVLMPLSGLLLAASAAVLVYSKFVEGRLMDVTVTILFMLAVQIAVLAILADLIARRNRD